jgi:hypothetical protein
MKIKAEAHSDDRVVEVYFDAAPWFIKATELMILSLAACNWGGDYPADGVAIDMADSVSELVTMFKYLELRRRVERIGFECHVNQNDALKWLAENQPHMLYRIRVQAIARLEGEGR